MDGPMIDPEFEWTLIMSLIAIAGVIGVVFIAVTLYNCISEFVSDLKTIKNSYVDKSPTNSGLKKISYSQYMALYNLNPDRLEIMWEDRNFMYRISKYRIEDNKSMYLYFNLIDTIRFTIHVYRGKLKDATMLKQKHQNAIDKLFYESVTTDRENKRGDN